MPEFTLSTAPLLALSLYLWRRASFQILPVVMFMSIFNAASIVNIKLGGATLGIAPSYLLLVVAIAKQTFSRRNPQTGLYKPLTSTGILVLLFASYAALGSLMLPWIFHGVTFSNQKFGILVPLSWNPGLLPQLIYLLASVLLYFVSAYRTTPAEISKSLNWYVAGAVFASLVAVYQYASMKTGLPFPSNFLHTNPTYGIFEAYEINGFPRMNATFTEASAAAFTFASALSISLWNLLSSQATVRRIVITLAVLIGLLLTISTTGYICLMFIAVVAGWFYLSHWQGLPSHRLGKIFLAVPVLVIALLIVANPSARESMDTLAHTVLLDKTKTVSYEERTQFNTDALSTAAQTYWLGAGWGVCRGSSVIPTMLGNVGIPGFALLLMFISQQFLPLLRKNAVYGRIHGAILFALATIMVDLVVSGPELTAPILWFLLAAASRLSGIGRGGVTTLRRRPQTSRPQALSFAAVTAHISVAPKR